MTPVLPVACALEFIHTYSLIHDDLPALDNDDLRRGMPTCHKKFGEAMAILAGDALLTLAFETLAGAPVPPAQRVALIAEIAASAGTVNGMVGGQVADLEAEGTSGHRGTARIYSPVEDGGADSRVDRFRSDGGGAPRTIWRGCEALATQIGWAFQVIDDILDVEESSAALGKTAGKDQAQQKATYPALFGLAKSHEFARDLATRAMAELEPYGERGERTCANSANFWCCGGHSGLRRKRLRSRCRARQSKLLSFQTIVIPRSAATRNLSFLPHTYEERSLAALGMTSSIPFGSPFQT